MTGPLRVLFVHPSFPNTFGRVVGALAGREDLQVACMVEERFRATVRAARPGVPFYSFRADRTVSGRTWPGLEGAEGRGRVGLGVARAIHALGGSAAFDVIVGSASNGCTLYLRAVTDAALVSFCEQPGYFMRYARPEFPATLDQYAFDIGYRAVVLASVAYSELGLVGSRYARSLFPQALRSKIRVQSEGCEPAPSVGDRLALRRKLGLPVDRPLVAFFGRTLEAVRGFDIFLHVAREVRRARENTRFLIIGSAQSAYGNERAYLGGQSFKDYALRQAGVPEAVFIWRDRVPYDAFREHLQCIDVAVLPTYEGASNWSFFDAMACGVAIVSSNRSFIPEMVAHGRDALLHDPSDVAPLASSVIALLDDANERQRLGGNAQRRIRRQHTPARAAAGYARIIREALALRRTQSR